MTLSDITLPIKNELREFDKFFDDQLKTNISLLNLVLRYLTSKKRKTNKTNNGILKC